MFFFWPLEKLSLERDIRNIYKFSWNMHYVINQFICKYILDYLALFRNLLSYFNLKYKLWNRKVILCPNFRILNKLGSLLVKLIRVRWIQWYSARIRSISKNDYHHWIKRTRISFTSMVPSLWHRQSYPICGLHFSWY